jgi:hypothetical protein
MTATIVSDAKLQRDRLIVVTDGKTVHDGWLWEWIPADQPQAACVEYRMHPDAVKSLEAFDRHERKIMRRSN